MLLLTAVVTLVLAVGLKSYIEQETVATVSQVVAAAVTVALGWADFRAGRAEAAKDLAAVTKELAADVRREWEAKATQRDVVESYALPVAWRPARSGLVADWADVVKAARGLPDGPPGDAGAWPVDEAGLEGTYTQIGEVFTKRVPTRRLVVLGEPGSGKTVLLIRLLQELARPGSSGPVPVLFSLASWNPLESGGLKKWMAEQLRLHHNVDLGHPASAESPETDRAQALVDRGHILPLLDGFDEIPPALHAVALHEINRAWRTQPLVLSSRTDAYRAALNGLDARRLDGAVGIQLVPLTPGPAAEYLRSGLPHAERWDAVIARLGSDTPVGQVLITPLGLFLARTIYAPSPRVGATEPTPHPDELCDTTVLGTRDELERHLFSHFITAVYEDRDAHSKPSHWSAQQARHTLATLARHLEVHRGGSTDLAWWELGSAVPAEQRENTAGSATALIGAVTVGLVAGLSSWLSSGLVWGLVWGLGGMLVAGLMCGLASAFGFSKSDAVVYPSSRFRSALHFGLLAALMTALALYQFVGARVVLQYIVLIAAGILWSRFNGRLTLERADLAVRVGPGTLVVQDRRIFLQIMLLYVLGFGAWGVWAFGLKSSFWVIPALGIGGGLALGLAAGLARGFYVGFRETAWAQFAVTKACLAMRDHAPWSLMAFLQDAHDRGILRQVGTVYQFRHIGLQRYLAEQSSSDDDALPRA
ncbi:NACHT domain-containing protein [Streptomyces sp. NPDC047000]|uniref:NACHT domain-containing protein n=1 Tax=Streptomyces sp. NPDC047000 TaxID=3155474 RepID=UPI0033D09F0F